MRGWKAQKLRNLEILKALKKSTRARRNRKLESSKKFKVTVSVTLEKTSVSYRRINI